MAVHLRAGGMRRVGMSTAVSLLHSPSQEDTFLGWKSAYLLRNSRLFDRENTYDGWRISSRNNELSSDHSMGTDAPQRLHHPTWMEMRRIQECLLRLLSRVCWDHLCPPISTSCSISRMIRLMIVLIHSNCKCSHFE
jgi:hypothetical protein